MDENTKQMIEVMCAAFKPILDEQARQRKVSDVCRIATALVQTQHFPVGINFGSDTLQGTETLVLASLSIYRQIERKVNS